jgi:hypothetical protein
LALLPGSCAIISRWSVLRGSGSSVLPQFGMASRAVARHLFRNTTTMAWEWISTDQGRRPDHRRRSFRDRPGIANGVPSSTRSGRLPTAITPPPYPVEPRRSVCGGTTYAGSIRAGCDALREQASDNAWRLPARMRSKEWGRDCPQRTCPRPFVNKARGCPNRQTRAIQLAF